MPYNTTGGTNYTLGASIGSTDTSILLSSFLEPISGTPYTMALIGSDIVYGTISPQSDNSEFVSFTGITQNVDGTATITGVTRGLPRSPGTQSAGPTYQLPHAGQSIFILSDAPQVFSKYAAKENDETITGQWTFTTFPVTPSNIPATTTALGTSKLSIAPVSAPSPVVVGTNDPRVPVAYAVDAVGTDAYAITPSPAITAYAAGQQFTFKAGTANTGAASLNVNALGAKTIKKLVSVDLATGDILLNQVITVVYDGTNMQIISTVPTVTSLFSNGITTKNVSDASTTQTIAHGLGITPKKISLTAYGPSNTTQAAVELSTGAYDGTHNSRISAYAANAVSPVAVVYGSSADSIALMNANNDPTSVGSTGIVTVDATNINIVWTKNGSPTSNVFQILWEANS